MVDVQLIYMNYAICSFLKLVLTTSRSPPSQRFSIRMLIEGELNKGLFGTVTKIQTLKTVRFSMKTVILKSPSSPKAKKLNNSVTIVQAKAIQTSLENVCMLTKYHMDKFVVSNQAYNFLKLCRVNVINEQKLMGLYS